MEKNNYSHKFWRHIFENKENFIIHSSSSKIEGKQYIYISEDYDIFKERFFLYKSSFIPIKKGSLKDIEPIVANFDFFSSDKYNFGLGTTYMSKVLNQIFSEPQEEKFIDYLQKNILSFHSKITMISQPLTDKAFFHVLGAKEPHNMKLTSNYLDIILNKIYSINYFDYDNFKKLIEQNASTLKNKAIKQSIIDVIENKSPTNLDDFKKSFNIQINEENFYTVETNIFACKVNKEKLFSRLKINGSSASINEKDYYEKLNLVSKGIHSLKKNLGINYCILNKNTTAAKDFTFIIEHNDKPKHTPEGFSSAIMKSIELFSDFPKNHSLSKLDLKNIESIFQYEELKSNLENKASENKKTTMKI